MQPHHNAPNGGNWSLLALSYGRSGRGVSPLFGVRLWSAPLFVDFSLNLTGNFIHPHSYPPPKNFLPIISFGLTYYMKSSLTASLNYFHGVCREGFFLYSAEKP